MFNGYSVILNIDTAGIEAAVFIHVFVLNIFIQEQKTFSPDQTTYSIQGFIECVIHIDIRLFLTKRRISFI